MILIISLPLSAFPLNYTRKAPTAIMAMSAAPFLHSKHLSFVILQLMEYTIYDYLIALDSK